MMAEEEQGATPYDGMTDDPTQTQPQTDPNAAPDAGTTAQDDQVGTTGDAVKAEKEAFYQTKYQQLKAEREQLLEKLGTYEQAYGELDFSANNQPAPPQQTQPQPQGQEFEFDPYDPNSMRQYLDTQMSTIRAQLSNVAKEAIQQARVQEKFETERQQAMGNLMSWLKKNEISEELQNEAAHQYQMRFGRGGTPRAMVEWVTDYIVKKSETARADATFAQRQAEAAEKGKLLAGAQLPPQGAAPSPTPQTKKSPAQVWSDDIAPDDPEPNFD